MSEHSHQLRALILAGGRSRRMGRDKAAMTVDGETQLTRTVNLAKQVIGDVFVSVRADQKDDPLRAKYPVIVDTIEDGGPLAGIAAAMTAYPGPWLILACDLPRLESTTLLTLIAAHRDTHFATALRSEYDELPEPLCAIWNPIALPLVTSAIDAGRRCARKVLIANEAHLVTPPVAGALDNANTPEEMHRIMEARA